MVTDLNAARKARAGNADTGLCGCGRFFRLFCREQCMGTLVDRYRDDRAYDEPDQAELEAEAVAALDAEPVRWLSAVPDAFDVEPPLSVSDDVVADHLADEAYKRWREEGGH